MAATAGQKMGWWIKDTAYFWGNFLGDILGEITAFPGKMLDILFGFKSSFVSYPVLGYMSLSEGPISSVFRQVGRLIGGLVGLTVGFFLGLATFWLGPIFQKTPEEKVAAKLKEVVKPLQGKFEPVAKKLGITPEKTEEQIEEIANQLAPEADKVVYGLDKVVIPTTALIAANISQEAVEDFAGQIPDDLPKQLADWGKKAKLDDPVVAMMLANPPMAMAVAMQNPDVQTVVKSMATPVLAFNNGPSLDGAADILAEAAKQLKSAGVKKLVSAGPQGLFGGSAGLAAGLGLGGGGPGLGGKSGKAKPTTGTDPLAAFGIDPADLSALGLDPTLLATMMAGNAGLSGGSDPFAAMLSQLDPATVAAMLGSGAGMPQMQPGQNPFAAFSQAGGSRSCKP